MSPRDCVSSGLCNRPLGALLCGLAILLSGGCSGEYNKRMGETIEEFGRRGALTKDLHGSGTPLTDSAGEQTGISIQMPKLFTADATLMPEGQGDAARMYPPFGQPLGFAFSYEQMVDGGDKQVPIYGYFAVVDAGRYSPDQIMTTVQEQIGAASWSAVQLDKPDGGKLDCHVASVQGSQKFGDGNLDGRYEVYVVPGASKHAIISWRAPNSAKTEPSIFDAGRASVGSLTGLVGGVAGGAESSEEDAGGESSEDAEAEGE